MCYVSADKDFTSLRIKLREFYVRKPYTVMQCNQLIQDRDLNVFLLNFLTVSKIIMFGLVFSVAQS
jgi:hypothetical protein